MTAADAPDDPSTAVATTGRRACRRTVDSHPLAWSIAATVAVCVAVAFPALFALLGDLVGIAVIAVIAVMAVVPWLLAVHDRRTDLPHSGGWPSSPRS
jgi:membrane protein implicated in regulation of membrane protease activity